MTNSQRFMYIVVRQPLQEPIRPSGRGLRRDGQSALSHLSNDVLEDELVRGQGAHDGPDASAPPFDAQDAIPELAEPHEP